jgi:hypothetical protein
MSVLILRPNSDSQKDQIPSTGTDHYVLVDEETLSETDYCYNNLTTDGAGLTDMYAFPNHTSESGTINSVTVKLYAKYILTGTNAGTPKVAPRIKVATQYYWENFNLTDTTQLYSKAWTTNPYTSKAWTWQEVDDLLAGDTLYMSGNDKDYKRPYCYQLWVEVDYTAGGGATVKPHYYYLQQ